MADRNPEVVELVTRELERDPDISVDALFDRATAVDPEIAKLSLRQFHARYPLPIKRRKSQGKRKRKPAKRRGSGRPGASGGTDRKPPAETPRDRVRAIFLEFAGDLARAESRAAIVEVVSRVDDYVDRVLDRSSSRKT